MEISGSKKQLHKIQINQIKCVSHYYLTYLNKPLFTLSMHANNIQKGRRHERHVRSLDSDRLMYRGACSFKASNNHHSFIIQMVGLVDVQSHSNKDGHSQELSHHYWSHTFFYQTLGCQSPPDLVSKFLETNGSLYHCAFLLGFKISQSP